MKKTPAKITNIMGNKSLLTSSLNILFQRIMIKNRIKLKAIISQAGLKSIKTNKDSMARKNKISMLFFPSLFAIILPTRKTRMMAKNTASPSILPAAGLNVLCNITVGKENLSPSKPSILDQTPKADK